jgi:predicted secreted Zn-dependent protease
MTPEERKAYKKAYYIQHKVQMSLAAKANYQKNQQARKDKQKVYGKGVGAIKKKIRRHIDIDKEKGRETDIDYDYVVNLLSEQDDKCSRCDVPVKQAWTQRYDLDQFSINRLDNSIGHIRGNVEITCLKCNLNLR